MAAAPKQNAFQQFIGGLFGNLSGTSAKQPAAASSYAGPYSSSYYTPAPKKATPAKATGGYAGANATYVNSWDAANSKAAAANIPYIPATSKGGGQSLVPNQTSAVTGKPASTVKGAVNPKADPGYVSPLSQQSTYSAPSSSGSTSSARTSTASYSPMAAAAPAAPPQAPVGSGSGFSYGSSSTGGGSGTAAAPSYRTAYTDMLSKMYNQDDLEDANESLDKLRKQTADAQLFSREEERRIRENEQGQGYKTFAGDMRENTRKSTAELADLAIASQPFEQYIQSAMTAAEKMYGVGRDEDNTMYSRGRDAVGDQRNAAQDALAERKFQEDVRQFGVSHALRVQSENRIAANANKPTAASKTDYVGQFAAAFTPGRKMADGTPTTDPNGFITPKAFKEAAAEAAQYGITRKEFIELFGSQLYADKNGLPDASYGLTNVEKKLVGGAQ